LERNWEGWKGKDKTIWGDKTSFSGSRNLEGEVISDLQSLDLSFFSFIFYPGKLGWGVTSLSLCHKSHDMVTVIITNHEIIIEGSKRFWKNNVIQYI